MRAPLRNHLVLFREVQVGEQGADTLWPGGLDMSNDTLWRLAQGQAGATMSAAEFRRWRERHGYTLDTAAGTLGLSRRMIAYHETGERSIPRLVALATKALEMAG